MDDHKMVRRGLSTILVEDGFDVVGEASNGEEALNACRGIMPDVVLMDLLMPVMGGVEAIGLFSRTLPTVRVIALSSLSDAGTARECLKNGASGYLVKSVDPDCLAEAIRSVHAGTHAISPEIVRLLANPTGEICAVQENKLTERELQVLDLILDGLSNSSIANDLRIGVPTVKTHVSTILQKTGLPSRSAIISTFLRSKKEGN